MEEKRRKTEHLDGREFLRLNFVIMDTAIRGRSWCEAWTDLHWIVLHSYVFVYIEDHLTQATRYRIFRCEDMADFRRHALLLPTEEDKGMRCLYDSRERGNVREIRRCEYPVSWHREAMLAASLVSDSVAPETIL